eukprot:86511-Karenia_brevis.AAC.1
MKNFTSQRFANTAWSFAALGHESLVFFDAIAEVATVRLENFNSQGFGNTVWAFAKVGHASPICHVAIALE